VDTVFYESKEEAYDRFREQFADTPELVDSVSPDILPAAFRVKLKDPELYTVVRDRFEARVGVEEIVDQRETLDDFLRLANVIRDSAFRVALIQLLAASVLIGNTIRVAAFARRDQTSIMKLVGASNWYIRLPFILEGIIAGLAGAVVSWVLLLVSVPRLAASLRANIDFVPFIGVSEAVAVGPILLGTGVLIASVSSVLALRRFLDV
jgi:cell division transport system permease protein